MLTWNLSKIAACCALATSFSAMSAGLDTFTSYNPSAVNLPFTANDTQQRYIVRLNPAADTSNLSAVATQLSALSNGKVEKILFTHQLIAMTLDKQGLNTLLANPLVLDIERDVKRYLKAQSAPYGIAMTQSDQVHQADTQARKVCVIDSGYDVNHPDLPDENQGLSGEANNFAVGSWSRDGNGHGTHVAGTIAALDNNQGVIGVYPGVSLHIVKIFNDLGQWTFASDLIDGIDQCQQAGANVVNMSLGGSGSSQAEANAMSSFVEEGMILVAAAGNDGNATKSYPASYDAVVSVGALDQNETIADYSQFNEQVELSAPGSSVISTYPNGRYASLSGTSMASPHVAGAMALVWSFYPHCSAGEIRDVLANTAKDLGAPGKDNYYGHGLIQVNNAMQYLAQEGCTMPPAETPPEEPEAPVTPEQPTPSGTETFTDLSGNRGSWQYFDVAIPDGVASLTVTLSGGSGDADLYLNFGSQPDTNRWECRPYRYGNNEVCSIQQPDTGDWFIGVRGYSAYSDVSLTYQYE